MKVTHFFKGKSPAVALPESLQSVTDALERNDPLPVRLFPVLVNTIVATLPGYTPGTAEELLAKALGHPHARAMHKRKGDAESERRRVFNEQRLLRQREAQRFQKARDVEQRLREEILERGTLATIGHPHKFFFEENLYYVRALESIIHVHMDPLLNTSIRSYPRKMTKEVFDKSFGMVWKSITFSHTSGVNDFTEIGFGRLRRIAKSMFCWHFRRYMAPNLISLHAHKLTSEYRFNELQAYYPDLEPTRAQIEGMTA